MTNEELAEIEARWAKATPAPWTADYDQADREGMHSILKTKDAYADYAVFAHKTYGEDEAENNAEAIAHAPEDIAALLAEVRKLRESLDAMTDYADEWSAHSEVYNTQVSYRDYNKRMKLDIAEARKLLGREVTHEQ